MFELNHCTSVIVAIRQPFPLMTYHCHQSHLNMTSAASVLWMIGRRVCVGGGPREILWEALLSVTVENKTPVLAELAFFSPEEKILCSKKGKNGK